MAKKKAKAKTEKKTGRPKLAPGHLSDEAAAKWEELRVEWRIDDRAGLIVLTTAFEAFDRMRQAQRKILDEGITGEDRFGQLKPNPACVIERDSRAAFLSAIRQLGIEPDDEV